MSQLDIKFYGAVLDLKIELEGMEVGLYFDGVSKWTRVLEDFEIDGMLDLIMVCKGLNGTAWELEITVGDREPITYTGEIKKGYSHISDEIKIHN